MKDYFLHSIVAAIMFMIPTLVFFFNQDYENLYWLFIGIILFMAVVFIYNMRLLKRPRDGQRATNMLIDGLMVTILGTVLCVILILITAFIFYGNIFEGQPTSEIISNSPAQMRFGSPSGLLFRIILITLLGTIGAGSFASVMVTYAGKRNQTKDKPSDLKPTT